jgi:pimeloyl-ACP methyl ester carboxylesterase
LEEDGLAYVSPDTAVQPWRFGPPGSPVVRGVDVLTVRDGSVSVVRTLFGFRRDAWGVVQAKGLEVSHERVGNGPRLVLVHGGADDRRAWQPQVAALVDEFAVVTWDWRGLTRLGANP